MKPPSIQISPPDDEKWKSSESDFKKSPVAINRKLYKDLVVSPEGKEALPRHFSTRFLGKCPTDGLWGIEHTQKQVDLIVNLARKSRQPSANVTIQVAEEGLTLTASHSNKNTEFREGFVPIESISYGVQDMIYTRIFALIVVHSTDDAVQHSPFECWAFACDSADVVHQLTSCLAEGFRRLAALDDVDAWRKPSISLQVESETLHSDA